MISYSAFVLQDQTFNSSETSLPVRLVDLDFVVVALLHREKAQLTQKIAGCGLFVQRVQQIEQSSQIIG
ncbi:MAG: hypothetical protein FJ077_00940 [Cyanobacteria bacterium K_DeepCast_35m_m2_023]|nr:hypothetical protein [Cyanobacteria bacterium K_DeepCast_35m_m2_023]